MYDAIEAFEKCLNREWRLVVVLGAGTEPENLKTDFPALRHPRELKQTYSQQALWKEDLYAGQAKGPIGRAAKAWTWDQYEYFRTWTARAEVPRIQFVLGHLTLWGYVDCLISLNYTRHLDHFFERESERLRLRRNPILEPHEDPCEGYYSPREPSHDPADDLPCLTYWKIHGDLGYASFANCRERSPSHVFRLPRFPISNRIGNILRFLDHTDIGEQFHHPLLRRNEHGRTDGIQGYHPTGDLQHHIDWHSQPDRAAFARECEGARDALQQALDDDETMVWLLGFTGHLDLDKKRPQHRNEELAPPIQEAIDRGERGRLWMSLIKTQYEAALKRGFLAKPLIEALDDDHRVEVVDDWDPLARKLYTAASPDHGDLETDYATWNQRWIP